MTIVLIDNMSFVTNTVHKMLASSFAWNAKISMYWECMAK